MTSSTKVQRGGGGLLQGKIVFPAREGALLQEMCGTHGVQWPVTRADSTFAAVKTISFNQQIGVRFNRHVPQGAFGWGLEFHWATQPGNKGMEIQKKNRDDPFTTPVMAGAAYCVEKEYFFKMGGYDPGMDGIGSENLELSFRIWICGGSVEINPCSRVGHVGRRRKPYKQDAEADSVVRNKMRVAEAWMDDYKWMFYRRTPRARELDAPDVSKRLQLHKDLDCGNFEWYMKEIYPDLHIVPFGDIVLHGEIRSANKKSYCLESNNVHGNPGSVVDIRECHGLGKGQYFEMTEQGEMRQNTISELCLAAKGKEVWTEKCRYPWHDVPDGQKWLILPEGHIYHPHSNLCLTANVQRRSATLLKCVKQGTTQLWTISQKDGYEEAEQNPEELVGEIVDTLAGGQDPIIYDQSALNATNITYIYEEGVAMET